MEVPLSAEQETQLLQLAQRSGKAAEALAQEAIRDLLDRDARFREAVEQGLTSLDRGEYVEHGGVQDRIKRLLPS